MNAKFHNFIKTAVVTLSWAAALPLIICAVIHAGKKHHRKKEKE